MKTTEAYTQPTAKATRLVITFFKKKLCNTRCISHDHNIYCYTCKSSCNKSIRHLIALLCSDGQDYFKSSYTTIIIYSVKTKKQLLSTIHFMPSRPLLLTTFYNTYYCYSGNLQDSFVNIRCYRSYK